MKAESTQAAPVSINHNPDPAEKRDRPTLLREFLDNRKIPETEWRELKTKHGFTRRSLLDELKKSYPRRFELTIESFHAHVLKKCKDIALE